jgi:hypothetical protein
VRASLALLIFSLKKKEACFLSSWNDGVPTLLLVLPLLKINMIQNRGSDELKGEKKSEQLRRGKLEAIFTSGYPSYNINYLMKEKNTCAYQYNPSILIQKGK